MLIASRSHHKWPHRSKPAVRRLGTGHFRAAPCGGSSKALEYEVGAHAVFKLAALWPVPFIWYGP